jgi:hypothetical protein
MFCLALLGVCIEVGGSGGWEDVSGAQFEDTYRVPVQCNQLYVQPAVEPKDCHWMTGSGEKVWGLVFSMREQLDYLSSVVIFSGGGSLLRVEISGRRGSILRTVVAGELLTSTCVAESSFADIWRIEWTCWHQLLE